MCPCGQCRWAPRQQHLPACLVKKLQAQGAWRLARQATQEKEEVQKWATSKKN